MVAESGEAVIILGYRPYFSVLSVDQVVTHGKTVREVSDLVINGKQAVIELFI